MRIVASLMCVAPVVPAPGIVSVAHSAVPPAGYRSNDPVEEVKDMLPYRWSLVQTIDIAAIEADLDRASMEPSIPLIVAAHQEYATNYRASVQSPLQGCLDAAAAAGASSADQRAPIASLAGARVACSQAFARAAELDRILAERIGVILGKPDVAERLVARFAYTRLLCLLAGRVRDARIVAGLPDIASMLDQVAALADTPDADRVKLRGAARAERIRGVAALEALPPATVGAYFADLEAIADRLAVLAPGDRRALEEARTIASAQDALRPRLRSAALRHFDAGRRLVDACRAEMSPRTTSAFASRWMRAIGSAVRDADGLQVAWSSWDALGYEVDLAVRAMSRDTGISAAERRRIEDAVADAHAELAEVAWSRAAPVLDAIHGDLDSETDGMQSGDDVIREGESPEAHKSRVRRNQSMRRMGRGEDSPLHEPISRMKSSSIEPTKVRLARIVAVAIEALGDRADRYIDQRDDIDGAHSDRAPEAAFFRTIRTPRELSATDDEEFDGALEGAEDQDDRQGDGSMRPERWVDASEAVEVEREAMEPLAPHHYAPSFVSTPALALGLRQVEEATRAAGVRIERECARAAIEAAAASPAGDVYRAARDELAARAKALPAEPEDPSKVDLAPVFAAACSTESAAIALDEALAAELEARCGVLRDSSVRALLLFSRAELGSTYDSLLRRLRAIPISDDERIVLFATARADLDGLAARESEYRAALLAETARPYGLHAKRPAPAWQTLPSGGHASASDLACARKSAVLLAVAKAADTAFGADDARSLRIRAHLLEWDRTFGWIRAGTKVARALGRAAPKSDVDATRYERLAAIEKTLWRDVIAATVRVRTDRCGHAWSEVPGAIGPGSFSYLNGAPPTDAYRANCANVDAIDALERAALELARLDAGAIRAP